MWNLHGRQWQNAFQVSLSTMAMQLSQNDFTVKLQYVRDHSCGSVDKPCERNGTFPHAMSVLKVKTGQDRVTLIALLQKRRVAHRVEGGKISQRYFFAEIVPPHIHESSSKGHQESDSWA